MAGLNGNMKAPKLIGLTWEVSAGRLKEQRCYGTYGEDMPDPALRFNVLFVQHDGAFKLHSHEYSELVVVLGGRGVHLTDCENYPLEEGDVFIISGNTRHGFAEAKELKLCNLQYDPEQFLRGHRGLDKMMGYHALFDLGPRSSQSGHFNERLHLSTDELVYVTTLLAALKSELDGRSEGRELVIESTFLLLVTYLSRCYASHKRDHGTPLVRMANVIAHIQKHFREPLRVSELARLAHLSESQFQRMFKRTYSVTPQKFVQQVRLHEAGEMLKDPNRDITHIAFDTGFSSSSLFSTQFKRQFGQTPSEYRRTKLAEVANRNGHGTPHRGADYIAGIKRANGATPARITL